LLTVASFRTWRGWAMLCCTGLDPKETNKTPTFVYEIQLLNTNFQQIIFNINKNFCLQARGADQDRTDDLFVANEALSQLSYSPRIMFKLRNNFYKNKRLILGV
jgi:hypothetical protein